ncbi:MAG: hypothetical protein KAS96_10810 [Planctomycetes bacterium]|nr:hypothetical protein [Planctomycetota bacterium]
MAKVKPTHSPKSDVYHDNNKCTERNNIETRNIKPGTGGNRKCKHCKDLDK